MLWKGGQGERSKGTGKDKAREGEQGKNSVRTLSSDKLFFDSIRYRYDMRVFFSIRYDMRAS